MARIVYACSGRSSRGVAMAAAKPCHHTRQAARSNTVPAVRRPVGNRPVDGPKGLGPDLSTMQRGAVSRRAGPPASLSHRHMAAKTPCCARWLQHLCRAHQFRFRALRSPDWQVRAGGLPQAAPSCLLNGTAQPLARHGKRTRFASLADFPDEPAGCPPVSSKLGPAVPLRRVPGSRAFERTPGMASPQGNRLGSATPGRPPTRRRLHRAIRKPDLYSDRVQDRQSCGNKETPSSIEDSTMRAGPTVHDRPASPTAPSLTYAMDSSEYIGV